MLAYLSDRRVNQKTTSCIQAGSNGKCWLLRWLLLISILLMSIIINIILPSSLSCVSSLVLHGTIRTNNCRIWGNGRRCIESRMLTSKQFTTTTTTTTTTTLRTRIQKSSIQSSHQYSSSLILSSYKFRLSSTRNDKNDNNSNDESYKNNKRQMKDEITVQIPELNLNDPSTSTTDDIDDISTIRQNELNKALNELNINVLEFTNAVQQSINNPLLGYDGRYGKSALKTYRSFVYSTSISTSTTTTSHERTIALAQQSARQIQFLLNRHKSHEMEWIRHHDGTTDTTSTSSMTVKKDESTVMTAKNFPKNTKYPIIIILDNVRSAMNVGNIFRTIDATNCEAIFTIGITPYPYGNGHDKLIKSSLGTHNTVLHKHFISIYDCINYIRSSSSDTTTTSSTCNDNILETNARDTSTNDITTNNQNVNSTATSTSNNHHHQQKSYLLKSNYTISCMETTSKSICYTDYNYGSCSSTIDNTTNDTNENTNGIVLVFGNEVTGVDVDFMDQYADTILEIPMYGVKNSLNIAACVPVVVYEIIRQWNKSNNKTS